MFDFKLFTLSASHLNNTRKAATDILFFNRVEKTGSQSLSILLIELAKKLDFAFYRNPESVMPNDISPEEDQQTLVEELMDAHSDGEAVVHVEHINWINFTQFEAPKPIYINLFRHPIDKVVSGYYYQRHPAIYSYYVRHNPKQKLHDRAWFDTSFDDCVRQAKLKECIFDSHNPFNGDWRRLGLHFCGNKRECK